MRIPSCPGCGSTNSDKKGSAGQLIEIHASESFIQKPYSIQKCNNCGLYYKDEVLDADRISAFYNVFDTSVWIPRFPYPTEAIVQDKINQSVQPGARILDYGCSTGRFLERFANRLDRYGFEIDSRAANIAESKGITMISESEIASKKDFFDVIILSDVFEHSLNPTELVACLYTLLKTGGRLFISTGYADAALVQLDIAHYWYFRTVQHFTMISDEYISFLVTRLNARLQSRIICSHYNDRLARKITISVGFWARLLLFKYISQKPASWQFSLFKRLPLLSKPTRWTAQPYFPFARDHIVVELEKPANPTRF